MKFKIVHPRICSDYQAPHNYKYDKCGRTIEDASKNTEYIYNNLGLLTKFRTTDLKNVKAWFN